LRAVIESAQCHSDEAALRCVGVTMAGMWWLVLDHPVSDSESACRLRVGF